MAEYTLSVKLKAIADQFNQELEKANSHLQELDRSAGSSKGMDGLVKKIERAVTALGLFKIAEKGIKYNAEIEQYQTSFEVMTGSADKARTILEKLKTTASKTPFELTDLTNATQLLMNYGFSADDAMDKMMMLGDISQGNAEKMQSIALAYGQMSSAGKVSLQDIKQMINAGFNPLQEISETTGESMESLYDRISKGTISIDEITSSMQRSTSEGGKYFQSMEKQSKTFNGQMSTLKDNVSNMLGKVFKPMNDFLANTLLPTINALFENPQEACSKLTEIVDKNKDALVLLGIVVGTIATLYAAYIIQQNLAIWTATAWATICSIATTVTTAFATAVAFLTSPIGLIIIGIGLIIAVGYLLITHWTELTAFAQSTWTAITEAFNQFDIWLTTIFTTDWTTQFGIFGNILNGFFAIVSGVWNSIKQVFSGIITFLTGVFTGNWRKAWKGITDIFGGIFGGIVAIAKAPLNGVIGLVNSAIDALNKISVSIPDWVPIVGGQTWGISLQKIPYLAHGTDNFEGGFAFINEGGRGELVNLPNGAQVIPHDVSMRYAVESARMASNQTIDVESLGRYIIQAIEVYGDSVANALFRGISNIKLTADDREIFRYLIKLGVQV